MPFEPRAYQDEIHRILESLADFREYLTNVDGLCKFDDGLRELDTVT